MADQEKRTRLVEDKLAEDLHTVVSFLEPHHAIRSRAKSADKTSLWSWRKTIAFVLVTGLIGWSMVLGVGYLLFRLWD